MAAPIRSTISRSGRPCVASIRNLSNAPATKAQVKSINPREPNTSSATSDASQLRRGALSRTYFDATGVRWVGSHDDGPKDPNKAKLGKSTSPRNLRELWSSTILTRYSFASSSRKITDSTTTSSASRHPCAQHRPSSLPFDTSSPANCLRPSRLQCRSLDLAACLEPCSHPRQRLYRGSCRAHDDRTPHFLTPPCRSYTRAACCPLVREAKGHCQSFEPWRYWTLAAVWSRSRPRQGLYRTIRLRFRFRGTNSEPHDRTVASGWRLGSWCWRKGCWPNRLASWGL